MQRCVSWQQEPAKSTSLARLLACMVTELRPIAHSWRSDGSTAWWHFLDKSGQLHHSLLVLQAMLHIAAIMRLGSSGLLSQPADEDSLQRMRACLRVLASRNDALDGTWLEACRASFVNMIGDKQQREAAELRQLVSQLLLMHLVHGVLQMLLLVLLCLEPLAWLAHPLMHGVNV